MWSEGRVCRTFIHHWWIFKLVQPLRKTHGQFLNKHLPYDPVILLLGIYSREVKTRVQAKTYVQINVPNSFICKSQTGNNPNVHQWVNG